MPNKNNKNNTEVKTDKVDTINVETKNKDENEAKSKGETEAKSKDETKGEIKAKAKGENKAKGETKPKSEMKSKGEIKAKDESESKSNDGNIKIEGKKNKSKKSDDTNKDPSDTKTKKVNKKSDDETKPKQKKEKKNKNKDENNEDDEETVDGKHIRSFKVMLPNSDKYEGRFTGLTPYQAANKALSKFFRESNKSDEDITFSICESTRKSKKSTYTYVGRRLQLEVPVKYKIQDGREIVKNFKNSLKKVKKADQPKP